MAEPLRYLAMIAVAGTLILASLGRAQADRGVVALRVSGCDYYVISTSNGFTVAEWYGGHDPWKGEAVVGSLNSYGFKTVFFGASASEGRIYIEEYWSSADDAMEQISEKCN
jgi:hypothetical protein